MSIQADRDKRLCDVCNKLGLSLTNNREDDETEYSLGTLSSIRKRWKEDTHCQFCRLVLSFLTPRPGRPFVRVRSTGTSKVTLVWTPKKGFNWRTDGDIIVFLNEKTALSPYGSGREIQAQIDPALIKKWLQLCEVHHGEKCTPKSDIIRTPQNPSGIKVFRVIDTQEQCIEEAKPGVRYVALSYVWGQVISVRLLRNNLTQFTAKGGLPKDALPKTIRDAIDLVNLIGERYLWVDALCLLQDDPDDMADGISKMDLVYLGATLTIVAAHGKDANAGLCGLHPGSRKVDQPIVEVEPGIKMTYIRGVYDTFSGSRYNSRGWTFQEVTLSHRLLVFAADRINFRCRQNCWGEDTIFDKFPLEINKGLSSGSYIVSFDDSGKEPLTNLNFLLYRYAYRSLTYDSDMVNAFTGMLRQLAIQLKSGLLEGIHTNCFDIGILFWEGYQEIGDVGRRREFPSWSWAGWRRAAQGFSEFCTDAAKTSSWLETMTYIDWYKRDPGTLKLGLVWDFEAAKENDGPADNNFGYRATPENPYGRSVERVFRPEPRDDEGMREDIRLEIGNRKYHLLQFWAQVVRFAALGDPDLFDPDTNQDSDSDDADSGDDSDSENEEDTESDHSEGPRGEEYDSEDDWDQSKSEEDPESSSGDPTDDEEDEDEDPTDDEEDSTDDEESPTDDEEDPEVIENSDSEGDSDANASDSNPEKHSPEVFAASARISKILDSHGTICGGVILDDPSLIHYREGPYEYILLSRVDRYENFFNNSVTTDRQMYWVLLIQWIGSKKVVAERRGVGFIFWDCLDRMLSPGKVWKEIVLA